MTMKADLVIGLDSSTTATKAIAFDRKGRAVAEGRAAVPLSNPKPGWFEQDVADWTGSAAQALQQVTRKVGAARIAAVAISNQRESFAQFDAQGQGAAARHPVAGRARACRNARAWPRSWALMKFIASPASPVM